MSLKSAQQIIDHLKSPEWKREKERTLAQYGRLLSLPELRDIAHAEGKTLAQKVNELRSE